MKSYLVYAPEPDNRAVVEQAADFKFLKEGYSILAALFGPFWLVAKQLWIEAAIYFVGLGSLLGALGFFGLNEIGATLFYFITSALFAIFARDIEAWHLERGGYRMVSIVTGKTYAECEEKYFTSLLEEVGI